MTKKGAPKKPKFVWVGNTPITPITTEESRQIRQRIRERREKLRQRYPEVCGRAVGYISHSIEDGTLFFTVAFKDKTNFSLRFGYEIFIVGADFGDMRTGVEDHSRVHEAPFEIGVATNVYAFTSERVPNLV